LVVGWMLVAQKVGLRFLYHGVSNLEDDINL